MVSDRVIFLLFVSGKFHYAKYENAEQTLDDYGDAVFNDETEVALKKQAVAALARFFYFKARRKYRDELKKADKNTRLQSLECVISNAAKDLGEEYKNDDIMSAVALLLSKQLNKPSPSNGTK